MKLYAWKWAVLTLVGSILYALHSCFSLNSSEMAGGRWGGRQRDRDIKIYVPLILKSRIILLYIQGRIIMWNSELGHVIRIFFSLSVCVCVLWVFLIWSSAWPLLGVSVSGDIDAGVGDPALGVFGIEGHVTPLGHLTLESLQLAFPIKGSLWLWVSFFFLCALIHPEEDRRPHL